MKLAVSLVEDWIDGFEFQKLVQNTRHLAILYRQHRIIRTVRKDLCSRDSEII